MSIAISKEEDKEEEEEEEEGNNYITKRNIRPLK